MFTRTAIVTALAASLVMFGSAFAADTVSPKATITTPPEQTTTDASLASKVKAALIDNETTKARQINVEAYRGQIQLNGFVDTDEQKMAAGQVAGQVAGATNVKNNLEVKQGDRTAGEAVSDGMITAKVKAALVGDSRTKAHQIDVNTNEGIVQLGGFVDSAAAKSAATEVAGSVSGVKTVQNKLNVRN